MTFKNNIEYKEGATPILKLPNLAKKLDLGGLYIKRDDLLDSDFGGSKIRSLKVQISRAIAENANILLMAGRCGSNSVAAASILAPRYGLKVAAFLKPQPKSTVATFNLRLINSSGTIIYPVPHGTLLHNESPTIENELKNLRQKGYQPYLIGFGGGDNDSAFAQISGIEELAKQINLGLCSRINRIYVAGATFSVAAGLTAGISLFNLNAQLVIIGLAHDQPPAEDFFNKAREAASRYIDQYKLIKKDKKEMATPVFHCAFHDEFGLTESALKIEANSELTHVQFDPVYTRKVLAHLIQDAKFHPGKSLLLWHTGNPMNWPKNIPNTPLPTQLLHLLT